MNEKSSYMYEAWEVKLDVKRERDFKRESE
jgi:hypothetical protein